MVDGNKGQKVVVISGCASGLGKHLVSRFVAKGYRVLATDINIDALKNVVLSEKWDPDFVWTRKLDVTKKKQWESLLTAAQDKWGSVDVLCNVAGYLLPGYISETDAEQIDKHIDINVKGVMHGSKFGAEIMVQQGGGHIVNIASLAGIAPVPGIGLYSASKFAVRGFSLSLAQELRSQGVSVSVVCPDAIETPMLTLQEDYEEAVLTFSGNRTLTVSEVADAIIDRALNKGDIEIMIPPVRGWLSKASNAIPQVSFLLGDYLGRIGRKKQSERKLVKT